MDAVPGPCSGRCRPFSGLRGEKHLEHVSLYPPSLTHRTTIRHSSRNATFDRLDMYTIAMAALATVTRVRADFYATSCDGKGRREATRRDSILRCIAWRKHLGPRIGRFSLYLLRRGIHAPAIPRVLTVALHDRDGERSRRRSRSRAFIAALSLAPAPRSESGLTAAEPPACDTHRAATVPFKGALLPTP